jgi:MoaA/NifB/PqqE/SkfB family radical SAM enzyme
MTPPKMLFFSHGNICNYRCVFCANPHIQAGDRLKLDYDWIKKYEDLISTAEIADISGYGEVMLCPDFERIMELFKYYKVKATFSTNGFAIADKIPFLKMCLIKHLNFSINAIHEDTYQRISGGCGNLRSVLSNFDKLREGRDFAISVSIVLNKWIIPELIEWTEFMISKRPDEIRMLPMTNIRDRDYKTRLDNNPLEISEEDKPIIEKARRMVLDSGIWLHPTGFVRDKNGIKEKKKKCKAPWEQLVIEWDGLLASCCWRHEDCMGNTNNATWQQIWESEKYQDLRNSIKDGGGKYCEDCREYG